MAPCRVLKIILNSKEIGRKRCEPCGLFIRKVKEIV